MTEEIKLRRREAAAAITGGFCVRVCTSRPSSTHIGMIFFLYAHTPYDAFRIIFLYAHEDVYSYQRRQKWTPLAFQHARTPTLNLFSYSHVRVLVCLRTRLSALVFVHMYASLSLLFAGFRVFVCAYSNNNRSSSAKIQSCTRPRCIHSTYYQQTAVYTSMKCTHLYLCGS